MYTEKYEKFWGSGTIYSESKSSLEAIPYPILKLGYVKKSQFIGY